jgi:hypothetical protein
MPVVRTRTFAADIDDAVKKDLHNHSFSLGVWVDRHKKSPSLHSPPLLGKHVHGRIVQYLPCYSVLVVLAPLIHVA